jgi:FtsP/CotA-like multicopper oxidase with cupredoxin domain
MYYNVFGEKVSRARWKEMLNATKNRRELIAAGLTRRELFKMGLLTSAGYLVAKKGLSADWGSLIPEMQAASPSVTPFVVPLPIMPIKQPVSSLNPAPTVDPNTAGGEGRKIPHQALNLFPPQKFFTRANQAAQLSVHPQLPLQTLWTYDGFSPGPTFVNHYGAPILVRNINQLPPASQNGGFGLPSVTTHVHNGHTPSESDGNGCDFFESGFFYDQHYPNVLAGILSDHPGTGDINEAMSTLWYHDHRVGFTAQNTYKGLVGYFLLLNEFDIGDETMGFHLPSFPQFDIPMVFADRVFDPTTGLLAFDLFNLDGILGDTFLVNGAVQPVLQVQPRRYRFRWLNVGPSRFHSLFITDLQNNGAAVPFWLLANDGNLLPKPIQVTSATIGVAERVDVIVDFSQVAGQTFYIENRLRQTTGKGPDNPPVILPGGQGNLLLKIIVSGNQNAVDNSADPSNITQFYPLPDTTPTPVVTRTFKFDRLNGQWSINGQFMDCDVLRFTVTQNTVERWLLTNLSGDWQHPIHIHFEEFQILSRNRMPPPNFEVARKDIVRLHQNERVELFFRFRDFTGKYPIHCHNTVHEDHAMMMNWQIQPEGDTNRTP